ncbi:hypothetical protein RDWZM_002393 [Blomia tropicalis]|uniref:Uncharacterized protein n=1 Tax=Blomia tropicalis TaxID=40697 RepID=A0A9Q0MCP8_BLOTA|nr:hypothetical protein RDWZM_002393 [Blomia tropicalis]
MYVNHLKKATYFQRFKDGMKRLIPKLRYSSGDPFPPQLDEYYRPLMAATNPHDTKWNHMTMGDSTIEDQHKKSSSIIYNCDQNRVGKCVVPEASLTTPPQPISSSNYQSVYKKK